MGRSCIRNKARWTCWNCEEPSWRTCRQTTTVLISTGWGSRSLIGPYEFCALFIVFLGLLKSTLTSFLVVSKRSRTSETFEQDCALVLGDAHRGRVIKET